MPSIDSLSTSKLDALEAIFSDAKLAKQVSNAAKRVRKKRNAPVNEDEKATERSTKRTKLDTAEMTPEELENSLALPVIDATDAEIEECVIRTNRAPLLLAFVVQLLLHTMPEQPLSSRLSLAQAVVSNNAKAKAISIGLDSGQSAEKEGWGEGQPTVTVMSREIRVMKRWGYDWRSSVKVENELPSSCGQVKVKVEDCDLSEAEDVSEATMLGVPVISHESPPLWGLDLEALKSSTNSESASNSVASSGLPIFTPQSARAYLLKSFETVQRDMDVSGKSKSRSSGSGSSQDERARNLALLLAALDRLYSSWLPTLSPSGLDQRAWSWYMRVRPDVANGIAGWGGKGEVRLADIMAMCRDA